MKNLIFGFCLSCLALSSSADADIAVGTWNIDGVEKTLDSLRANSKKMVSDVGPLDILILQEVISAEQVGAIAEAAGFAHWAISDFSPPKSITNNGYASLEVAVLSRIPMKGAAEWDTTGREPSGDGYKPRSNNQSLLTEELELRLADTDPHPSRGFLRVQLEGELTIYAVHWKSSRGQSCNLADIENASLREVQAHGLAKDMGSTLASGQTVIVGGDFNIQAPGNVQRSGVDVEIDCAPISGCDNVCGESGLDGYDDSIQILLNVDQDAKLLSADTEHTYVNRPFPGGAIDHLLVAGKGSESFSAAFTPDYTGDRYSGSDHRPVISTSSMTVIERSETDGERLRRLISEVRTQLLEIESLANSLEK